MLGVGDLGGTLHILEVPWSLRHPSSHEVCICYCELICTGVYKLLVLKASCSVILDIRVVLSDNLLSFSSTVYW